MKKEIVFFPYKASMWDSMESVWMAAAKDEKCDVYVVPIPYYDKNRDGTLGEMHYEGNLFPEYVPITDYKFYDVTSRRPDAAYTHYPYDEYNYVTTIDPNYYSKELYKYVKNLIYIPYFATTGGMSAAQRTLPAYFFAKYIMIQADCLRQYYDERIPAQRLVALGSPKFDKVIRLCENPPKPPQEWKQQMEGKTVYFYNTSLGGMLADTNRFIGKLSYVFTAFLERKDVCLLWRPHPLMESTFASVRADLKPVYDKLKNMFIDYKIGIYDDTPDIEKSIALSDVYIGDSATSVTSLFGIAGKPLFIMNNFLTTEPKEDDYGAECIFGENVVGNAKWLITANNHLYHAKEEYCYEHVMKLNDYVSGGYFQKVVSVNGKTYVCPQNGSTILEISGGKIKQEIPLEQRNRLPGAFAGSVVCGKYIFLIPARYPALVRLDTVNNRVDYIEDIDEVRAEEIDGDLCVGGFCCWNNYLVLGSPKNDYLLCVEADSLQITKIVIGLEGYTGSFRMQVLGEELWILPRKGTVVLYGNPLENVFCCINFQLDGFFCQRRPSGFRCDLFPFSSVARCRNSFVLAPYWGNMFLEIDREENIIRKWEPPFPEILVGKNGYHNAMFVGKFLESGNFDISNQNAEDCGKQRDNNASQQMNFRESETIEILRYYSDAEKCIYELNPKTKEIVRKQMTIPMEELEKAVSGFGDYSEWLQYGCQEDALHTLRKLLKNELPGEPFSREKEIEAFAHIAANNDGTAGDKIHEFVMGKL
ncbi:MAG: hypothetical protein ACI4DU_00245 [Lachnospiraceae bacterium]